MADLQTMIKARASTPSPLQELRRIRRENLSDEIAMTGARVNNELKRLQIEQLQSASAANREVGKAVSSAFQGRGGAPGQGTPEQSVQAAQNIKNRLAENPQMIEDLRTTRDKLYSLGNDTAFDKAGKLDKIIGEWEQRNFFGRKAAEEERKAAKTSDLEAARAWYATPEVDKEARFAEFKQVHGITGVANPGDMDVWARDLKAAAEDTDLTTAGGPLKPATANALLTRAEKIKKNFDAEVARYYPEISKDNKGNLLVDSSYDEVRRAYAKEIDTAAQSQKQFDPTTLFAKVISEHRLVKKPRTGWGDGLDDMDRDVFVPIPWMDMARQQNGKLTEGQIAVLYSMALNDKLKNQGKTSTKTWNLFVKHGLAN